MLKVSYDSGYEELMASSRIKCKKNDYLKMYCMNGDLTGLKVKRKSHRKILTIPSQKQVLPPVSAE